MASRSMPNYLPYIVDSFAIVLTLFYFYF